MAYETGTATGPADLLAKLATFAAANTWTVDTVTGGRVFRKGTVIVGANAGASAINLRGALAFNAGAAWNAQTNAAPVDCICTLGAGPYTAYHFNQVTEAGRDLLMASVETSAGVYRHFAIADLVKQGAYTGGTVVDAVEWSLTTNNINSPTSGQHQVIGGCGSASPQRGHISCDYDGKLNNWQRVTDLGDVTNVNAMAGSAFGSSALALGPFAAAYSRYNLRTVLVPIRYFANRAASLRSNIGRLPGLRLVNMDLLTPGQLLTIGGETWQCWPWVAKNPSATTTQPNSGNYGYAILR